MILDGITDWADSADWLAPALEQLNVFRLKAPPYASSLPSGLQAGKKAGAWVLYQGSVSSGRRFGRCSERYGTCLEIKATDGLSAANLRSLVHNRVWRCVNAGPDPTPVASPVTMDANQITAVHG